LDEETGRAAAVLLGRAGMPDVIDAAIALLAHDGDRIVTSDVHHLRQLAAASGRQVEAIEA
jgi:predicted nucleic acid-binding protein